MRRPQACWPATLWDAPRRARVFHRCGVAAVARGGRGTSVARLRWAARRYRRFPLIGSWPSLINSIGFEAPLLLIVAFYGAHTGGLFAFAQRLIGAPVALFVLAVSQVFVC